MIPLASNTEIIYSVDKFDNEDRLLENGLFEAYRLVTLRYPDRDILESDVELLYVKSVIFNDSSLDCPRDGYFYSQIRQPGYILTFKYREEYFHLNTSNGERFVCVLMTPLDPL